VKSEKNKVPDCVKCGKVDVIPENYLTYGLIEKYSSAFVDGMGGINASGIKLALEVEDIPLELQRDLIKGILLFVTTGLRTQRQ